MHYEEHGHLCLATALPGVFILHNALPLIHYLLHE
jgi:hypothetical protein